MQFLTMTLIIEIHKELINEFGGIHGVRDENLLDSAVTYAHSDNGSFNRFANAPSNTLFRYFGIQTI
jgi:prophage maintenance system killer protein